MHVRYEVQCLLFVHYEFPSAQTSVTNDQLLNNIQKIQFVLMDDSLNKLAAWAAFPLITQHYFHSYESKTKTM